MKLFKLLIALTLLSCLLKQVVAQPPAQRAGDCEQSFSKTVTPTNPQNLSRLITQGAILSRGQELEFQYHLKKTISNDLDGKGLKDVLEFTELYPPGSLNKLALPQQDITFYLKQKTAPDSLAPFVQSFRSKANKIKGIYQISANWGLWAKLLSFESQNTGQGLSKQQKREAFFEYLNQSPLGQSMEKFITSHNLTNLQTVSSGQTVKQFIENPLSPYREKTIVLYKVLESFREDLKKQKDIAEKLSILMAELIHATGFNNPVWIEQLKSKNPDTVMEAVRLILSERDQLAIDLGFTNTHYQGLKSSLLDSFSSPQVKSTKKELSIIQDQVNQILKDLENQPVVATSSEIFTLRALSLQESPFRGCLGNDCSTDTYFEKALDPAYLYFTLTDKDLVSHGHITVVLGTAQNPAGDTVKTAFVDKIQNIPNHRIIPMLEGIQLSLTDHGYHLVLPKDLGGINGLSNDSLTSDFVKSKIISHLKNIFHSFKVKQTDLSFVDAGHSRAGLDLDLLEFKLSQSDKDFKIQIGEVFEPKNIDESFKIKDWFFKAIKSKNEEDQLLLIANLPELVKFNFLTRDQAIDYLKLKIKDRLLSFELRKKSMFSFLYIESSQFYLAPLISLQVQLVEAKVQKIKLIESLLLEFKDKELTSLIGEMSNWKNTNHQYRKNFVIMLSEFFSSQLLPTVLESSVPGLFKSVADINIQNKDGHTPLHFAVYRDDKKIIPLLFKKGAKLSVKDNWDRTALYFAVEMADKEMINLLLKGLEQYDQNNSKKLLLGDVAVVGSVEMFEFLITKGLDIYLKDRSDKLLTHKAVIFGKLEILKLLIDKGVPFDTKNIYGYTPLMMAIIYTRRDIINLLLKIGADPNSKDIDGHTSLHHATYGLDKDIYKTLLEAGGNPNIKNNAGDTSLHIAIHLGKNEMIKLSLQYGADPNITGDNGTTSLAYAKTRHGDNTKTILLLKSYGATE